MHIPVLLNEVIKFLDPQPNENFIDATVGEGGHTLAILQRTAPGGKVLGIDLDPEMLNIVSKKLKAFENRLILVQGNFRNIKKIVEENKFKDVQGVLFDLGVNLYQLKKSGKGFTFQRNEPLLMTFGPDVLWTAEEIVNSWPEEKLAQIFREYGEEKKYLAIARAIVRRRKTRPLKTTFDLLEIIGEIKPFTKKYRIHPATKIFQALRIATNDELNNLRKGLEGALEILEKGGRIVVISFHSLEDRIVKNFFKANKNHLRVLTKKPIVPQKVEIFNNPSARSAKLRAGEKI